MFVSFLEKWVLLYLVIFYLSFQRNEWNEENYLYRIFNNFLFEYCKENNICCFIVSFLFYNLLYFILIIFYNFFSSLVLLILGLSFFGETNEREFNNFFCSNVVLYNARGRIFLASFTLFFSTFDSNFWRNEREDKIIHRVRISFRIILFFSRKQIRYFFWKNFDFDSNLPILKDIGILSERR